MATIQIEIVKNDSFQTVGFRIFSGNFTMYQWGNWGYSRSSYYIKARDLVGLEIVEVTELIKLGKEAEVTEQFRIKLAKDTPTAIACDDRVCELRNRIEEIIKKFK